MRAPIERPAGTAARFNRRTYLGKKVGVRADYRGALDLGHQVTPLIHEVFGGWAPDAIKLFRQLARCHRDLLEPELTSWAARSFTAYHSQRISTAIHTAAAQEIVTGRRYLISNVRRGRRQQRGRAAAPRATGAAGQRVGGGAPRRAATLGDFLPAALVATAGGANATAAANVGAAAPAVGAAGIAAAECGNAAACAGA
mgnify:FL=1